MVALGVLSLGEWALSGLTSQVALWCLVGVPLSALALFGIGWKGVRVGSGDPPAPWMTWATLGTVVPYVHGLYVFGFAGLQRVALGGWTMGSLAMGLLYAFLGLRLLRDALKVAEVGRLGIFMSVPAPEELESS